MRREDRSPGRSAPVLGRSNARARTGPGKCGRIKRFLVRCARGLAHSGVVHAKKGRKMEAETRGAPPGGSLAPPRCEELRAKIASEARPTNRRLIGDAQLLRRSQAR